MRWLTCDAVTTCTAVCFNIYDQDDSGGITFDEFATVMQIIAGEDFDGELHKAEHLAKAFECMDTNRDSVLSFEGTRLQQNAGRGSVLPGGPTDHAAPTLRFALRAGEQSSRLASSAIRSWSLPFCGP